MTVLQVCAFAAPSAGNFIASLTMLESQLRERNIQTIYAFADGAEGMPWCREIQKRTKVYFLPTAKARILPKTYQIFRRIYAENDISIMHSHFELYDIPATVTAPKRVKIFWHLHDALKRNYLHASAPRKLLMRVQYGIAGRRSMLLSVSREHAEFVKTLGFPAGRIVYFPNGINLQRIRQTSLHKAGNDFLMFGWEVIRKGVDLVNQAAEKVQNPDFRIRIVGRDECRRYMLEKVHTNTLIYHPPVEDVNDLYRGTKGFLHVSRAEGQSYALLEVIYAGIPVICSNIPENQFASEFRNVFFVENEDADAIAAEIDRMISWNGCVAEEDVLYNRALIEREYSLDAWCDKLIGLYLE